MNVFFWQWSSLALYLNQSFLCTRKMKNTPINCHGWNTTIFKGLNIIKWYKIGLWCWLFGVWLQTSWSCASFYPWMRKAEKQQLNWSRFWFSIKHFVHTSAKKTISEIVPCNIVPFHPPPQTATQGETCQLWTWLNLSHQFSLLIL